MTCNPCTLPHLLAVRVVSSGMAKFHLTVAGCVAALMLFAGLLTAPPAAALDDEHWRIAQDSIDRGIAFLRTTQNDDGSWSPEVGPAITALAITPMLRQPDITADDPTVARALEYILSHVQEDGSIRLGPEGILANYNTAISLSALALVNDRPDVAEAIAGGQAFLVGLQWQEGMTGPNGETITEDHPYYGGAGYGGSGRPDMSNTNLMLQALHDTGMDCNDPAFVRAVAFISRCQGVESNDFFEDGTIENDGGFIYATAINSEHPDIPVSYASPEMVDEARAGRPVSGLRGYGSVTYAGFKSFVYAQLDRDDPRVQAALGWIQSNYTLENNPGMPERDNLGAQGLFYYYMTHGRALNAWGMTQLTLADGTQVDWANNLIAHLASLQSADGSWVNQRHDRWMEDNANLVTAYSLIALTAALD
jgi:squalene-hopene/tetraprenyl-beta-curcumene cyclase